MSKITEYKDSQSQYAKDDRGDATGAFAAFVRDPSPMDQEPLTMATGGMIGKPGGLVEDGVEYYAKKVKLTPTMKSNIEIFEEIKGKGAYDTQEAYVKKRIRDGANVGEGSGGQNKRGTEEVLELVSRREDGPQLVKDYNSNPTKNKLEELRLLAKRRKTYENQMFTTKKRYDEFRAKKRPLEIRAQNSPKGLLQKIKRQSERGMFPAATSKERVWRDIWRATQNKNRNSRFKVVSKIPEKVKSAKTGNLYVPWSNNYKNVEFLDTETNKKITFNNLEKYMDKNIGKNKYKEAISTYDLKKQFESAPIKYKGNNTSLGQILRTGLLSEAELNSGMGFSAIEVNHKGKNLDEFWNTEITTRGANRKLVPLQSRYGAMFKKAKTDSEKKKIIKQFTNQVEKLPGGITTVFEGAEIGIKPTAGSVINSANKAAGAKITKPQIKQILSQLEKLGCGKAAGGRINMRTGGPTDCALAGQKKLAKGLAVGFKEGEGALAQKILQAGKGLKNMASLRGLLGPAALGFTVAAEAGIVGYDMLATGKSFKDVVGNSLFNNLLGDKTKIDTDEIRYKNYERLGINTDQIKKFEEGLGEINQMAQVYNDAENSNYKMLMGQTTSNPRVSQAMRDRSNKALILKNEKNQQAATDLTTELSNPEKQKSLNEFAENTDLNRSLIASADQRVAANEIQKPSTANFRSGMQTIFPRSNYDSETDKIINYQPVMQDYYRTNQYSAGGIADLMKKKND